MNTVKAKTIQHHIGGQLTAGGSTRTAMPGIRLKTKTKFVYDFSEGSRDMRVLRGRKRVNVAERARVPGAERVPEPIARMAAAHAAIRSWASIELPDKLARQKEAAWV